MTTRTDTLKVRYVVDGDGKVLGSFKQVQSELEKTERAQAKLEKSAERTGKVIGGALATGIGVAIAGLGLYIKNTIEAERVQAQLAARIKDTAGAAGRSLDQLNAQAQRLQQQTIFDNDTIGNAQALLLTFKNLSDTNFDRAVNSTLDLATALDTDATSAARQLGAALNDPVRGLQGLTRAGITFTDAQRKQIKAMVEAGDIAAAQRVILDRLDSSMGSAAETARDTLGGAFVALKNAATNLLQGDSGSEGMVGLRTEVEGLITTLNDPDVKRGTDQLAEGLLSIANAAIQALSKLGNFIKGYEDFLAKHGFQTATSDTSLQDLQTRRDKLQAQLPKYDGGGLFGGIPDLGVNEKFSSAIRQQLAEIDALINIKTQSLAEDARNKAAQLRGMPADFGLNLSVADPTPDKPKTYDTSTDAERNAAARAAEKAALDRARAMEAFNKQAQDLAAELGGPLDKALLEHNRKLAELDALAGKAGVSSQALAAAKADETERYNKEVAAIQDEISGKKELALLNDQLAADEANQRAANAADLAEIGHGGKYIEQMRRRLAIERQYAAGLDSIRRDSAGKSDAVLAQEEAALRASRDRMLKQEQDYQQQRLRLEQDWSVGARAALEDFAAKANDVAGATRDAISSGLEGAADVLADFVTKGKANFADLFESIIRDFAKMEARILLSKALEYLIGLFGGGGASITGDSASVGFGGGFGRAGGGGVQGAGMYEVAEQGNPELLRVGSKTYLMMGADSGEVIPARNASPAGAAAGGGGNVYLTVENNGQPAKARTETSQRGGDTFIKLILDAAEDRIASSAAQPGGKVNGAIAQTFGLSRRGVPVAG